MTTACLRNSAFDGPENIHITQKIYPNKLNKIYSNYTQDGVIKINTNSLVFEV